MVLANQTGGFSCDQVQGEPMVVGDIGGGWVQLYVYASHRLDNPNVVDSGEVREESVVRRYAGVKRGEGEPIG